MAIVYIPVNPKEHVFSVGTTKTPVNIPPGTFQFLTKADAEMAAQVLADENPETEIKIWETKARESTKKG